MSYEQATARYAALGIDTEAALAACSSTPVSIHCWQGDDIHGFERADAVLDGGIQATGNYPGRARSFEELTADFDKAIALIPGKKRLSLHANYAIFTDGFVDRDKLEPKHFAPWVEYAKQRGLGLDFNPTIFSHEKAKGLTLSHPDPAIRKFWVDHCIACRRISAYFAKELGTHSVCNVWIPDGLKDVPADRLSPRLRLKESLDEIFAEKLEGVIDTVESKVFGIGMESYTVGSNEFYLSYAATHPGVYNLLDNGHYHPTEVVSDKIPALLGFFDKIPLHVTRGVRWDSDHVVLFEDEVKEIAKEIVRTGGLDGRVKIAMDYFDASVNRIAAWVLGFRNVQKALLMALLTPDMTVLQDEGNWTELMVRQEELKSLPFGDVWQEYCRVCGVAADGDWFGTVMAYEKDTLRKRGL
jgi:L-rhamnose isomerase